VAPLPRPAVKTVLPNLIKQFQRSGHERRDHAMNRNAVKHEMGEWFLLAVLLALGALTVLLRCYFP
jgi:hypothetical protein